jgi:hypothetical protein
VDFVDDPIAIWIEDEKGRFSTKAAYKVIQEQKIIENNDVQ